MSEDERSLSAVDVAEIILGEARDGIDKRFALDLSARTAIFLLAPLVVHKSVQKKRVGENTTSAELIKEDDVALLREQFERAYKKSSENGKPVGLNLSFREVGLIGQLLLPERARINPPYRFYYTFLELNAAFTAVGGKDNIGLREVFEKLVEGHEDLGGDMIFEIDPK